VRSGNDDDDYGGLGETEPSCVRSGTYPAETPAEHENLLVPSCLKEKGQKKK